jgi:HemK-related putative methylase
MFDRLRKRLVRAMQEGAGTAPPRVGEGAPAAALRAALAAFHADAPDRYEALFLRGEPHAGALAPAPVFERAGLVERRGSALAPCVRVFSFHGLFVATDLLARALPDQVFSLMFEQDHLARNMGVRPGDEVLELCLGSGVNALVAAGKGGRVTGVDVNPRAAAFARFNRALNGADFEVIEGSLFEPLGDRRFDLVLVNPPFELVPPGEAWFLHSHGGEDGLSVVREILAGLPAHMKPGGRFEIITWSPATKDGPLLTDLLRAALPDHRLEVQLLEEGPLDEHIDRFEGSRGYGAWRDSLRARGIDRVEFLFARANGR